MLRSSIRLSHLPALAGLAVCAAALAPAAEGQTASALVRESEDLPGGTPGDVVTSLNNTAVNGVGGFAVSCTTTSTSATLSQVWGAPSGGAGAPMRAEGTFGDFVQNSFESFYGMGNLGELAYSAICDNTLSGSTSLDGVWLDDMFEAMEEEPVSTSPVSSGASARGRASRAPASPTGSAASPASRAPPPRTAACSSARPPWSCSAGSP